MKKKSFLLILLISLMIFSFPSLQRNLAGSENTSPLTTPSIKSLTPYSYIDINDNSGFAGFNGTGSQLDPYRIEDLYIETAGHTGIDITNVDVYFVIQNCYITASSGMIIFLHDIADGRFKILYNNFVSTTEGVIIYNCAQGLIDHNNFTDVINPMYVESANYTVVSNNNVFTDSNGILCDHSQEVQIAYNTIQGSPGVSLSPECYGANIHDNTFTGGGLLIHPDNVLEELQSFDINNNYINGKILGYFIDQKDLEILTPDYGQLYLINCSNAAVVDQVIVGDTGSGNYLYDISLWYCHTVTLSNSMADYDLYIFIKYSEDVSVSDCTATFHTEYCNNISFSGNSGPGMFFWESYDVLIYDNTMSNGYYGIQTGTIHDFTIQANRFYSNTVGILLPTNANCTITQNIFENNEERGLWLGSSTNCTISENTFQHEQIAAEITVFNSTVISNTFYQNVEALLMIYSRFNNITNNLFQETDSYGISIQNALSSWNNIHHNTFVDNNVGGTSQAFDEGPNNTWYEESTLEGNYWSDFSGTGNYSIDGSSLSFDLYPLNSPVIPPIPEYQAFSLIWLILIVPFTLVVPYILKTKKNLS